jgi:Fe2+ transport system protein FeoA
VSHRYEETSLELPLTKLKDGESGTIVSITTSHGRGHAYGHRYHQWGFKKRLEDMGLTPGTEVTVVKSAPFHGPVELKVRGARMAIGRGMAERILVKV